MDLVQECKHGSQHLWFFCVNSKLAATVLLLVWAFLSKVPAWKCGCDQYAYASFSLMKWHENVKYILSQHTEVEIQSVCTTTLTYLLNYSLMTCSRVLPDKLTGSQLVKKFPGVYGTRRFITAFTSARTHRGLKQISRNFIPFILLSYYHVEHAHGPTWHIHFWTWNIYTVPW